MVQGVIRSWFLLAVALTLPSATAFAQSPAGVAAPAAAPVKKKKSRSISGSPLDTIMQTRLKADVPPAQDFVRATHPDPSKLDYTPLTGADPERPKPRDPANVMALQAELERDGSLNARKANGARSPRATGSAKHRHAAAP